MEKYLPKNQELLVGYLLGALAFIFSLFAAYYWGADPILQILICLVGGAIGWLIGLLASPLNDLEKTRFSDLSKALLAVITGFVIAKLEPAIVNSLESAITTDPTLIFFRTTLFSLSSILGVLFTFVGRLFGEPKAVRLKRQAIELNLKAEKIRNELSELLERSRQVE